MSLFLVKVLLPDDFSIGGYQRDTDMPTYKTLQYFVIFALLPDTLIPQPSSRNLFTDV